MIIDTHAHYCPPELFVDLAARAAEFPNVRLREQDGRYRFAFMGGAETRPLLPKLVELEQRRTWMREQGIDHQVFGGWLDMFGYGLPPDEGERWSRFLTGHLAAAADAAEEFSALASVPLQDGARAAAVLGDAMDQGLAGAMIGTQPRGSGGNLDDPGLDPFWQAASEREAVIYLHPEFGCPDDRLDDYGLQNAIGRGVDTTIALSRLICSGHLTRFPGMKMVVSHGGGAIPFMLGRLGRNAQITDGLADPYAEFQKLYFDTVVFDPGALHFLIEASDASRLMLGSDYPFPIGDHAPRGVLERSNLNEVDTAAILGGTAARLFRLGGHRHGHA